MVRALSHEPPVCRRKGRGKGSKSVEPTEAASTEEEGSLLFIPTYFLICTYELKIVRSLTALRYLKQAPLARIMNHPQRNRALPLFLSHPCRCLIRLSR